LVKEIKPKTVEIYADEEGYEPYTEWLEGLRDVVGRKRIMARSKRLAQGNYGDCEPVGDGVLELKMHFGPGYRVYFKEKNDIVVLLLCGGDKGSQQKDIENAKSYWKEYVKNA
jgi:putative addiction module killer protein